MKIEIDNQEISTSTMISYGQSKYTGIYALAFVANELWAGGAEEMKVEASVTIPPIVYKSRMNGIMKMRKKLVKKKKSVLKKQRDRLHLLYRFRKYV